MFLLFHVMLFKLFDYVINVFSELSSGIGVIEIAFACF